MGLVGYRSYWQSVLLDILKMNKNKDLTVCDLSMMTSIRQEDIVSTLSSMDMIRLWKGEHTIWYLFTYLFLSVTPKMTQDYIRENKINLNRKIDPLCIQYEPY